MHKTRTANIVCPAGVKYNSGVHPEGYPPGYFTYPSPATSVLGSNEWIDYTCNGGIETNHCFHKKLTVSLVHAGGLTARDYRTVTFPNVVWHYHGGYLNNAALPNLTGANSYSRLIGWYSESYNPILSLDWKGLSSIAMDAMWPTFNQGFSIINFLYEIREAKRLLELWKRRKSPLYNVAGGHLNLNFGWKPFLSDVMEMLKILSNLKDRLAQLKRQAGKLQRRHYETSLTSRISLPAEYASGIDGWGGQIAAQYEWVEEPVYHATLVYTFRLPPDIDTILGQCKQWLDAFGVSLDPSILWNALPFSFIVDWFFGVGSFLHSLRRDNIDLQVTVLDFCHSAKIHARCTHYIRQDMLPLTPVWVSQFKSYHRSKALPGFISSSANPFSKAHFELATSLTVVNSRMGRKRQRPSKHII